MDRAHVPINALSPPFSDVYAFTHFNRFQSECFDDIYLTDSNMVISAPTASGKTVLLELAIFRLFGMTSTYGATKKALYLAPLKALCAEKAADWHSKFAVCGLRCVELVGENTAGSVRQAKERTKGDITIFNAHVICATPEKWLSTTESLALGTSLQSSIDLLLLDECHMVGTSRGAFLELAVASVRQHSRKLRVVATSATISNISDISEWLSSSTNSPDNSILTVPAKTCVFGPDSAPKQMCYNGNNIKR
ncbi:ATP-dependent DNA helicase MER3 [Coemansia sp. RSA 1933]|nr:ATP-dependent DNA helicase MER3 [Coemansia sp. RSA 1933]